MSPHLVRRYLSRLPEFVLVSLLAWIVSGCSTRTYKVEVNSLTRPEVPPATTYLLTTRDPNLPDKDLGYYEVADRVRTALAAKGMYEAPVGTDPDIVVEIDYGEHAPHTSVTTVRSTQLVPTNQMGAQIDPITGRPYPGSGPMITIGGNPNVNPMDPYGSTNPMDPYGRGGMQTVQSEEQRITTVSEKYIRLTATEGGNPRARAGKKAAQVWIAEAIVEDEKSDVHECMPALVNALTDYIGVSSGGKRTVTISTDEP